MSTESNMDDSGLDFDAIHSSVVGTLNQQSGVEPKDAIAQAAAEAQPSEGDPEGDPEEEPKEEEDEAAQETEEVVEEATEEPEEAPQTEMQKENDDLKKQLDEALKAVKRLQKGKYSADAGLETRLAQLETKLTKPESSEDAKDLVDLNATDLKAMITETVQGVLGESLKEQKEQARQKEVQDQITAAKNEYKDQYDLRVSLVEDLIDLNPEYNSLIESATNPAETVMTLAKLHPEFDTKVGKIVQQDSEGSKTPKIDSNVIKKAVKQATRPTTSAGMTGRKVHTEDVDLLKKAQKDGSMESWGAVIGSQMPEGLLKQLSDY